MRQTTVWLYGGVIPHAALSGDMARRVLTAALLALLIVTAGCVGTTATAQTEGTNDPSDVRTIDVSGQGTASAAPDLAKVQVAVEVQAETADAARAQAAEDVATMREALREIGIPEDAVRTVSFHVGPEYDHSGSSRELVGYRAAHAFEIETDVDRAGEVIDASVENGATRVNGVQFTLTDDTRRELRNQALTEAMSSARADAETIASAAGVSVGTLQSASTADVDYPRPVPYAMEAANGDGGSRTVVEPGPVEVTATVSVSYAVN